MGSAVTLIDSGAETARLVAEDMEAKGMKAPGGSGGRVRYFVTDSIDGFSELASRFLDSDVHGMVEQIILE